MGVSAYVSDVPKDLLNPSSLAFRVEHLRRESKMRGGHSVVLRYGPGRGKRYHVRHGDHKLIVQYRRRTKLPATSGTVYGPPMGTAANSANPTWAWNTSGSVYAMVEDAVIYVPSGDLTLPDLTPVWVPENHRSIKKGPLPWRI